MFFFHFFLDIEFVTSYVLESFIFFIVYFSPHSNISGENNIQVMTCTSYRITSGGRYHCLFHYCDTNTGCITVGDAKFDHFVKVAKLSFLLY